MSAELLSFPDGGRAMRSPAGTPQFRNAHELEQADLASLDFEAIPLNRITAPQLLKMVELQANSVVLASGVAALSKREILEGIARMEMAPRDLARLAAAAEEAMGWFMDVSEVMDTALARIRILRATMAERTGSAEWMLVTLDDEDQESV